MTIFYLDFEGGNDANDGTTFANRWKTIASGATASRTAPGDVIRVMATPDPVNVGTATWTDNSGEIVWAAAKNKVIDNCESGWVASANVTATYATPQKQGSARLNLAFAAAFTTGKAAYKTLPAALDLSAFEQISFWWQNGTAASQQFSVKLCSDTTGDTPVATLSFNPVINVDFTGNVWTVLVGNNAASLGASINSIAIYADADPGTASYRLDNIVACKAAGTADEVSHKLIFGKNTAGEPEWYNIGEISDAGIVLGAAQNSGPSMDQPMPYRGPTEAVATYKRYCFEPGNSSDISVKESGTVGNPISYSGGWNRTDMSTQTGETWLSGNRATSVGISMLAGGVYINSEKFGFAHFTTAGLGNINGFQTHNAVGFVGCNAAAQPNTFTEAGQQVGRARLTCDHVWGCNGGALGAFSRPIEFSARLIHGDCDNGVATGAFSGSSGYGSESIYNIERIENNRSNGVYAASLPPLKLRGTTFKNNLNADLYFNGSVVNRVELDDCQLLSSTPFARGSNASMELVETRIGGNPAANKTTRPFSYFQTQATTVHSGERAWEMGFTEVAAFWQDAPSYFPLASIACNAGTLVTVKAWLRRDNAAVGAGLHIRENPVQGIVATTAWMTAAIDTWEEVTLTFTPATAGVFEIFAAGYGPVGNKAFFDGDVTVTQA